MVVNVLRAGVDEDPRHADDQQLEIARDQLRRATVRERPEYLSAIWNVVNWDKVNELYQTAK